VKAHALIDPVVDLRGSGLRIARALRAKRSRPRFSILIDFSSSPAFAYFST